MYLRLQLPDLVPEDLDRVLYLDSDVLCTNSGLFELFRIDMNDKTIAAVRDATTRRLIDNDGVPAIERFPELDPQAPYFNSGVLLIDTKKWRSRNVRARCEDYLKQSTRRRFPDQDALNVACYDDWFRLNKRWNHLRSNRLDTHKGNHLDEAVIVHFNSTIKLWHPQFPEGHRLDLYRRYRVSIDEARSRFDSHA